jgi:cysteine desulfurase
MDRIYFDNAATTPVEPAVQETMLQALQGMYGNPSSIYNEGRTARAAIERARKQVAEAIGASIGEVFFTSGGTESNNMALKCAVRDLGVERIISARTEHHCILHSLDTLQRTGDLVVEFVNQHANGHIDIADLEARLKASDRKTMVSLMHSNNEIGTMIDLDQVSALCEEHGALFHSDTVQTIGYYPIDVSKTKMSFISGSAHKFHGPKGVGFIYINGDNLIKPYVDGGSQERNMRGGTENIYGILGMAKALELAIAQMAEKRQKVTQVRDYMLAQLRAAFPDITINGDPEGQGHYKVLSVSFPASEKAELLLFNLDIAGISVSGGSACSSGADAGSHVIGALYPDSDRKTIRFSFSHHNTKEEVDVVITQLKKALPVSVAG